MQATTFEMLWCSDVPDRKSIAAVVRTTLVSFISPSFRFIYHMLRALEKFIYTQVHVCPDSEGNRKLIQTVGCKAHCVPWTELAESGLT